MTHGTANGLKGGRAYNAFPTEKNKESKMTAVETTIAVHQTFRLQDRRWQIPIPAMIASIPAAVGSDKAIIISLYSPDATINSKAS